MGMWLFALYEGRRTPLHRVLGPGRARLLQARRDRSERRAELAALRRAHADLQRRAGAVHLCDPARCRQCCRSMLRAWPTSRRTARSTPRSSFTTNTNWQWYSGEAAMSNLSQMVGLTIHNFLSRRDRHRARLRAVPRLRAAPGEQHRQFLGGLHAHHALSAAADLHRLRDLPDRERRAADARRSRSTPPRWRAPSRRSRLARSPARKRSRCSAPTAAASSTPIPRIRSRIPTR